MDLIVAPSSTAYELPKDLVLPTYSTISACRQLLPTIELIQLLSQVCMYPCMQCALMHHLCKLSAKTIKVIIYGNLLFVPT